LANWDDGSKAIRHWCSTITTGDETAGKERLDKESSTSDIGLDIDSGFPDYRVEFFAIQTEQTCKEAEVMTDRAKFISDVTTSLGRSSVLEPSVESNPNSTAVFEDAATAKSHADRALSDASERSTQLTNQMANMAAVNGWKVHRAGNPEDAADLIAGICEQKGAKSVLRSIHQVLSDIGVDSAVTNTGATLGVTEHSGSVDDEMIEQAKSEAFTADIGITGVDYAVAETGTVVLHPVDFLDWFRSLLQHTSPFSGRVKFLIHSQNFSPLNETIFYRVIWPAQ
jgi:L-lactate utilization protein LutC